MKKNDSLHATSWYPAILGVGISQYGRGPMQGQAQDRIIIVQGERSALLQGIIGVRHPLADTPIIAGGQPL